MRKYFLTILIFGAAVNAWAAGDRVGNGGDALVCQKEDGNRTAKLLDYHEAQDDEHGPGRAIDLGPAALSVRGKVELVLGRVARLSPGRSRWWKEVAEPLLQAADAGASTKRVLFTEKLLEDVPDSDHFMYPKGCSVQQLAIRIDPDERIAVGGYDYVIQKDLWALLDNDSRAGLILHEVLYRDAVVFHGQKSSRKARFLNGLLADKAMEKLEFVAFARAMLQAGYSRLSTDEMDIELDTIEPISQYSETYYIAKGKVHGEDYEAYRVTFDRATGRVYRENTRENNYKTVLVQIFAHPDVDFAFGVESGAGWLPSEPCFKSGRIKSRSVSEGWFGSMKHYTCMVDVIPGQHDFSVQFSSNTFFSRRVQHVFVSVIGGSVRFEPVFPTGGIEVSRKRPYSAKGKSWVY